MRMHELKTITVSDLDFYQKVIDKYQKGKRNPFRFPMMIFYKHAGCVLSQKINIDILLQLYLHNRNIFSSLVVKSVQNMKRLFSWFRTEKLIPQFITKTALLRSLYSLNKMFILIRHETGSRLLRAKQIAMNSLSFVRAQPETFGGYDRFPKSETSSFSQGQGNQEIVRRPPLGMSHRQSRRLMQRLRGWKVLQPLFSIPNTILYLHDVTDVSAPGFTVNRQLFNYGNYVQTIKSETGKRRTFPVRGMDGRYPSSQKENIGEYPPVLEHKSPAILPQVSCLQNKSSNETFQNWTTVNKPLIKHYHYNFALDGTNSITSHRRTPFKEVLQPLFSIVSAPGFTVNRQLFNYGNYVQTIKSETGKRRTFPVRGMDGRYPSSQKENIGGYPPGLEHKSPAILPQVNSLLNNRSDKTFQNWTTVNKPLIKHYHYNFGSNAANSLAAHRRTLFKAESEDLYFYHQNKIDQEIKEIKKIVVETKDAVKEKSLSSYSPMDIEIKRHLDLSRLTDQVYQMLERKIEIERERRGLYR